MVSEDLAGRDISTTFVKGISVLKAFDDVHTHLTISEISELTRLDRASVRRLLLTLVHLGYARKDGRQFSLTPRVLVLAGSFLQGNAFGTQVQPLMNRFAAQTDGTVSLAVLDESSAVYVAQSSLEAHAVSFGFTVGSRLPLMHTAVGRMILAYESLEWAEAFVRSAPVTRLTPQTVIERSKIMRRVATCRDQGYAIVSGEFEVGVTGIAVPLGTPGALKAVVGTPCPDHLVADDGARMRTVGVLRQLARELSHTRMFARR